MTPARGIDPRRIDPLAPAEARETELDAATLADRIAHVIQPLELLEWALSARLDDGEEYEAFTAPTRETIRRARDLAAEVKEGRFARAEDAPSDLRRPSGPRSVAGVFTRAEDSARLREAPSGAIKLAADSLGGIQEKAALLRREGILLSHMVTTAEHANGTPAERAVAFNAARVKLLDVLVLVNELDVFAEQIELDLERA